MPSKLKKNVRAAKSQPKRKRLSPAIRKADIIESAASMVVQQGYLPLPIEQLATRSGVSKALFYTYFPDQYALFNRLLDRELSDLLAGGMDLASQVNDIDQAAVLCATLYFEHVARCGPLLHILLADRYMSGHVERRLLQLRNTVLQRLADSARPTLKLSKAEMLATIEMMIAIPEEAGRLVFTQELDVNVGRQLCRTLIASAMRTLRNPDAALVGLVSAHHVA
jgi:AcrR family transcriptional regulator